MKKEGRPVRDVTAMKVIRHILARSLSVTMLPFLAVVLISVSLPVHVASGQWPPQFSGRSTSPFSAVYGQVLNVTEVAGGAVYNGTWTRRPGTDIFDAVWNGTIRDVIEIESVNGNTIVFYRYGNNGRYYGSWSEDGSISGTASWYAEGWYWVASGLQL
ncbi:MAG: hypothetical protein FDX30_04950 [Chlorobium sp.]|nr:MAG: hypothetical protein FDX30_04950 [Chlorobium sp.]